MRHPYDFIAESWHASPRGFRARQYVDLILGRLRPGARVLDLGCGTGVPVAHYLVERGFPVVGVDQSARMLKIASQTVPKAQLIQGDMCSIPVTGGFAAAIAWDSIFHVARVRHQTVFRQLSRVLEPGGWLLLSAGGSGDEGFASEMYGHEFFYSGYEPEETVALLRAEGFEVERWEVDDPSSRGHVMIIARKVD